MIIVKVPFRMSFFGGGTDIPDYFNERSGAVISTTFDKYCYVTVRHLPRFFNYRNSIIYSKTERVQKVDEIEHPLVRNCMKYLDMHELSVTYDADLPARTGLGTSSSFAVGLLTAFHSLKGKYVDKKGIASEAIHIEREVCKEAGGWQDQVAVSFGGLNRIDFRDNDFSVAPVIISPEKKQELEDNLMLFFTGFSRLSSEIQKDTGKNLENKADKLKQMYQFVNDAEAILTNKYSDLDEFGELLNESWMIKRGLGDKVSTDFIDELYREALKAGAVGGKLLGAGGGGFLLFYVPKDKQKYVRERLNKLLYIPFCFEDSGAQVVYYKPEDYSLLEEYMD